MAGEIILVDTSILIDFYRRTDKANSVWIRLVRAGYEFSISAVTKYEILAGATRSQLEFRGNVFQSLTIIPFDELAVDKAVDLNTN